jgi:formate dehydrogenase major subunit
VLGAINRRLRDIVVASGRFVFAAARRRKNAFVAFTRLLESWPVVRQLREGDPLGLGKAARSERSRTLEPRIAHADHVAQSICPFCAVGCAQLVYVKDGEVIQVEGDPASPISRGRLCPKGAATKNMHSGPLREYTVKYRRPYGTHWEELPLEQAMDMIAERIVRTREETWQQETPEGNPARRTLGIANLGGATLDNEENYLMKKLLTALGVVQVENQARI